MEWTRIRLEQQCNAKKGKRVRRGWVRPTRGRSNKQRRSREISKTQEKHKLILHLDKTNHLIIRIWPDNIFQSFPVFKFVHSREFASFLCVFYFLFLNSSTVFPHHIQIKSRVFKTARKNQSIEKICKKFFATQNPATLGSFESLFSALLF